jgi:hypothetical protein
MQIGQPVSDLSKFQKGNKTVPKRLKQRFSNQITVLH